MKFDTPDVMAILRGIAADLKQMKLWPAVAVLIIAIVAVPLLLSKSSSSPPPVAQVPQGTPPPANGIPAVSVQSTPAPSKLTGRARNPFGQQASASSTASTTATTATTGASATSATGAASSGGASTGAVLTGGLSTGGSVTAIPTPPSITPAPAPAGLTATQSYDVTLSITNSAGGVKTIDPLERLSVLPSVNQPILVELGVLQGGHRVLFAVQPQTVLHGPGRCTPGRIDCEILSLGRGQTERLSIHSPTGTVSVAEFAVTAVHTAEHSSAAAADTVRRTASAAGRDLLRTSMLSALPLFQYNPSLGAIVDLRDLTILHGTAQLLASTSLATSSTGQNGTPSRLDAHVQLMPEGLGTVLRSGVLVRVSSNEPADGIVTVSISRSAASRAHIETGHGQSVKIGVGTVSGIKDGTVSLHLRLQRAVTAKLDQLVHVTLMFRFALVAASSEHLAIDVAGRY